ncbi:MAG: rRNA maturation RNase YbeY [Gammaproteobacteria bacterium]|nr:rRNA maturation RNase YbeY [Gammaproteobacteria bacterium]
MNQKFNLYLDLQMAPDLEEASFQTIPKQEQMELWVRKALSFVGQQSGRQEKEYELTIRVVSKSEIQSLNQTYRHKNKPTNVLSFPYESFSFDESEIPVEVLQPPLLGDLVICHDIVVEEAQKQDKTIEAHWTHMIVHGILHLKGYDHIDDSEADIMEGMEIKILDTLHLENPYL